MFSRRNVDVTNVFAGYSPAFALVGGCRPERDDRTVQKRISAANVPPFVSAMEGYRPITDHRWGAFPMARGTEVAATSWGEQRSF